MKYQDFSSDENFYPVKIQFVSFTWEGISVIMAPSVSSNRERAVTASRHRCLYNKQNITCRRVDTNFILECSTRYPTSERSERQWDI